MEYVTLGRTNLMVSRSSLGTKLLQDVSEAEAVEILNTAYDGGINFFDTSSAYSDVEKKLGKAIYSKRKNVININKINVKIIKRIFYITNSVFSKRGFCS